jgi:hypothetical protein
MNGSKKMTVVKIIGNLLFLVLIVYAIYIVRHFHTANSGALLAAYTAAVLISIVLFVWMYVAARKNHAGRLQSFRASLWGVYTLWSSIFMGLYLTLLSKMGIIDNQMKNKDSK